MKLLLENATAEAYKEGCLKEHATAAGRFGNRYDTVENATAEADGEGCLQEMRLRLVVSGIDVALSQCWGLADVQLAFMHRCGAHAARWSLVTGPIAYGNQSATTKKCICEFWTRCGISYSQWYGV